MLLSFWYHFSFITLQVQKHSPIGVFFKKCDLQICSKYKGEHPGGSVISVKLHSNLLKSHSRVSCFDEHLHGNASTNFYSTWRGGVQRDLGCHSIHDPRQQHDWKTFHEAYALLLWRNVLELHPETITNAGRHNWTDYWNVPAIEGK